MGVVDQTILIVVAVLFILLVVVLTNFKYWRQDWRRRRWPSVKEVYLKILHDKLSDGGTQYTILGSELWDRVCRAIKLGDREYPLYGGKVFKASLVKRIDSIIEDIKEDNAVHIQRRIRKEYNEYLKRKEEHSDTDQSRG